LITWSVWKLRSKERSQLVTADALDDIKVYEQICLMSYEVDILARGLDVIFCGLNPVRAPPSRATISRMEPIASGRCCISPVSPMYGFSRKKSGVCSNMAAGSLPSFSGRPILITGLAFFSVCSSAMTYTTNFPNTENPISEDGHWQNGATNGIDWTDCRTKPGLVFWHRKRRRQEPIRRFY
jgi:hypothetical protein